MSRSCRRRARQKARGPQLGLGLDLDRPESCPLPDSTIAEPRVVEDLQLVRDMIAGGWRTPAEGRLRLMSRLVAIADAPGTPPAFRLGAINALTRIDEHLLKLKMAEQAETQAHALTHPVEAALRLLAGMTGSEDSQFHANTNTNTSTGINT